MKQADASAIMCFFRAYLQQVVTLHTAMFQKLLFEGEGLPLELAELFEDVGNTYISVSESISTHHLQRRASEVEKRFDTDVEPTLRRIKPQLRAKPRVRRAKHLAQPVKG
jgi:hypothetical protein